MNFNLISFFMFVMTAIRIIERVFFHVYQWQLKEYRWDRYRDYLKTRQGLWLLLHPWYWLGWFVAITPFVWRYLLPPSSPPLDYGFTLPEGIILFYVILSVAISVFTIVRGALRYPLPTGRAIVIVVLMFSLASFFGFFALRDLALLLSLILLLFIGPLTSVCVYCSSFPANYLKRRTIAKAKAKIASLPNLKVIGITGSYGKSSTKEFLATILSTKYKVCKTPKNNNSEIGVAQTILRDLKPEHEVFIVEMGAYQKGEIKAICDIVHPTIGVLTAVSEQHLALFGSLAETKKAKYELIEALPENGVAIFNSDNRATRELAEQTLKSKKLYSTERPADIFATAITVQPDKLSFDVITEVRPLESGGRTSPYRIEVNLLGAHLVSNLLAAIAVAHTLGMTLPEIAEAIKQITPLDHTLKPYHHKSGAFIIDDSYSANPDGVLAALNHLKLIPRKYKVLLMMPMIELGGAAKDAHRKVGERIGEVCDLSIFTQKNFFGVLRKSSQLPNEKILVLSRPQSILNALTPYLNGNSVILLENRIPALITKTLTS